MVVLEFFAWLAGIAAIYMIFRLTYEFSDNDGLITISYLGSVFFTIVGYAGWQWYSKALENGDDTLNGMIVMGFAATFFTIVPILQFFKNPWWNAIITNGLTCGIAWLTLKLFIAILPALPMVGILLFMGLFAVPTVYVVNK